MWIRIIHVLCSVTAGQAGVGELLHGGFLNLGMMVLPLILMLTIHACNDQEFISNSKTTGPTNGDSIAYRYYALKDSTGQCGGSHEKCTRVYLRLLRLEEDGPAAMRISRYLDTALQMVSNIQAPNPRALADSFLKEMKPASPNEDYFSGAWLEVTMRGITNADTLFSVEAETSTYQGGAHGMGMRNYFHFDPKTGRVLRLNDLFSSEKRKTLLREAEAQFRKQYNIPPEGIINDKGFWFENDAFSLPSEFYLTPDTIHFIYNPYEVAPYAAGIIDIAVKR